MNKKTPISHHDPLANFIASFRRQAELSVVDAGERTKLITADRELTCYELSRMSAVQLEVRRIHAKDRVGSLTEDGHTHGLNRQLHDHIDMWESEWTAATEELVERAVCSDERSIPHCPLTAAGWEVE